MKPISDAEFKLEISKGGSACTLGGNMENMGDLSEDSKSITIKDFSYLMISCAEDLGQTNPKGVYELKFTMDDIVDVRTVTVY